jgi:predicted NBD/HSP70 family sugar kinase
LTIQLHGSNLTDIKEKNRSLALHLIATEHYISRADLARKMHLTKTTLGNIVSQLIAENLICEEYVLNNPEEVGKGRKPIALAISPVSPLIAGMLIKRNLCTVILADISGTIIKQLDFTYKKLTKTILVDKLVELYKKITLDTSREIMAIGISSIGPVNTQEQKIMSPANFWGIHNLPIVSIIEEKLEKPAFLIHDCSAGALAEKLYGTIAKNKSNFMYLHIMNGIGLGYIVNNKVFEGDLGQSGEFGHMSINFSGPRCGCGNHGCLELYANTRNMNKKIHSLQILQQSFGEGSAELLTWHDIIDGATAGNPFYFAAVDEFCDYLSYAMINAINLFDIRNIILGYETSHGTIIEDILQHKLSVADISGEITLLHSSFNSDAPLIGSIAVVTNKIFNGEIKIPLSKEPISEVTAK